MRRDCRAAYSSSTTGLAEKSTQQRSAAVSATEKSGEQKHWVVRGAALLCGVLRMRAQQAGVPLCTLRRIEHACTWKRQPEMHSGITSHTQHQRCASACVRSRGDPTVPHLEERREQDVATTAVLRIRLHSPLHTWFADNTHRLLIARLNMPHSCRNTTTCRMSLLCVSVTLSGSSSKGRGDGFGAAATGVMEAPFALPGRFAERPPFGSFQANAIGCLGDARQF